MVNHYEFIETKKQQTSVCKCCGFGVTPYLGSVDFNRTCHDVLFNKKTYPVANEWVDYYGCPNCAFIFTNHIDSWSKEQIQTRIYGADYIITDPPVGGDELKPKEQRGNYLLGKHMANIFDGAQQSIRVLDFGAGGNPSLMGQALLDKGFATYSYEPYLSFYDNDYTEQIPEGHYQVITAIEVMEHCQDLEMVGRFMQQRLAEHGVFWIQTLIHPNKLQKDALNSWYVGPRNGHVSIFSQVAITLLLRRFGINCVQTIYGTMAFKKLPNFPNKIFIY